MCKTVEILKEIIISLETEKLQLKKEIAEMKGLIDQQNEVENNLRKKLEALENQKLSGKTLAIAFAGKSQELTDRLKKLGLEK